jgi:hypothetical protein
MRFLLARHSRFLNDLPARLRNFRGGRGRDSRVLRERLLGTVQTSLQPGSRTDSRAAYWSNFLFVDAPNYSARITVPSRRGVYLSA